MLSNEHLQALGTVIGGAVAVLLARFVMVKEAQKPHQTPAERPPTEHQVKSELAELRNRIDHANDLADDDRRAIYRFIRSLGTAMTDADQRARAGVISPTEFEATWWRIYDRLTPAAIVDASLR